MITNMNKNVICVKDLPSNLIEEAIFILKTDMNEKQTLKKMFIRKELVLKETEEFVKMYSLDLEKQRIRERELLQKKKAKIIISAIIFVAVCLLVSIILHI